MPQSSLVITGQVVSSPSGSKQIGPLTIFNTSSIEAVNDLLSLSGDNVITVPSTTTIGCVIVPPAGNTAAIRYKGAGGDVGIPLHPTFPQLLVFPAGTVSFILNIGAAGLLFEITWF